MLLMTLHQDLIDVIIRTKNSQQFLRECLEAVLAEIPIRRIIIVDAGSTDRTKEIAISYDKVEFYSKPDLNLGEATKYGISMAQTEWVAIIDSDIVLRKGWFENLKKFMNEADVVEGCRIDHFLFNVQIDTTKSTSGRLGHTLLKKEPILRMDLDTQFGEDTVVKFNFDKEGKKWKKVPNFLADHYTRIDNTKHKRTGVLFRPEPQVISIPKDTQIQQGHIVRKCHALTKKQAIKILLLPPIYEAYWAFKKNFWFTLAYFRLI
jgi:glycosyltransferase involved in cell wall biosynthesis